MHRTPPISLEYKGVGMPQHPHTKISASVAMHFPSSCSGIDTASPRDGPLPSDSEHRGCIRGIGLRGRVSPSGGDNAERAAAAPRHPGQRAGDLRARPLGGLDGTPPRLVPGDRESAGQGRYGHNPGWVPYSTCTYFSCTFMTSSNSSIAGKSACISVCPPDI